MNACVNTYEMRMPAHYVGMNKKEMEYSGCGFDVLRFCEYLGNVCVGAAGVVGGCAVVVVSGWTGAGCIGGGVLAATGAAKIYDETVNIVREWCE